MKTRIPQIFTVYRTPRGIHYAMPIPDGIDVDKESKFTCDVETINGKLKIEYNEV